MKAIPCDKFFKHDHFCFLDRKIIQMKEGKFKSTLNETLPPEGLSMPLEALWWQHQGNWERAHSLAQRVVLTKMLHGCMRYFIGKRVIFQMLTTGTNGPTASPIPEQ